MSGRLFVICLLAVLPLSLAAGQQNGSPEEPPLRRTPIPTEGFWPTRLMIDRVLDRITEEIAEQYELDEEQMEKTRALLKERVPLFLDENRAEIQTLMNQFFEVQLAGEPPAPEEVAGWSKRVLPLVEKLENLATQVADQMRSYLSEEQVLRLEGEMAAFQAGLNLARGKLQVWADGGYDPQTEWVYDRAERRRREREERRRLEQEMQAARQEVLGEPRDPAGTGNGTSGAAGSTGDGQTTAARSSPPVAPATQPAAAKDEWELYVEDFTRRYELNEAQRQEAQRILRARQKDRDEYLRRKAGQLEQVAARMRSAASEAERQKASADAERLNAPVKRMFQQLKDQLGRLPTRAQREAAARRALESAPTTQPARGA
jgi:hypothetical protein